MRIDYDHYSCTGWERLRYLAEALLIGTLVNYLCYQIWWLEVLILPFGIVYIKLKELHFIQMRKKELNRGFQDALLSLTVALKAGYSMENAISEVIRDLEQLYPKKEPILQEFYFIRSQLKVSVPVETLFADLGQRSGVEDIKNFASVYKIAKRSGGNLSKVLQRTAQTLSDKMEVMQEIEACIAAKQMEQRIMSVVPCGIICYMQITSPGFLDVLYGNMFGIGIMTCCLAGYVGAYYMGQRIVKIEV